jgi:hypothetical protein
MQIKERSDWDLGMFARFSVTVHFRNRICGGIPKSPDLIDGWISSIINSKSKVRSLTEETRDKMISGAIQAETIAVMEPEEDAADHAWCGFAKPDGLAIAGRQVKAGLKEAASILSGKTQIWGFKSKMADHVFVEDDWVLLGVDEPSGMDEGPVHVTSRFGEPQTALKRHDYVERPQITFTIKAIDQPLKDKKKNDIHPKAYLQLCLELLQELGLGANRSQGWGRFDVVSCEAID